MNDMHDLIAGYLLQSERCSLPPLGVFTKAFHSAKIDSVNKLIYPPFHQFTFENDQWPLSSELVEYISYKNNIDTTSSEREIATFCEDWIKKIRQGELLCFKKIGCLKNDEQGHMQFSPEEIPELLPVLPAVKVFYKNAKHDVLVGDRETNSEVMKDYYSEQPVVASGRWKLWAAILLVIGLAVIIFSLYNKGFAPDTIGNSHHLKVDEEPKTYKEVVNEK